MTPLLEESIPSEGVLLRAIINSDIYMNNYYKNDSFEY